MELDDFGEKIQKILNFFQFSIGKDLELGFRWVQK